MFLKNKQYVGRLENHDHESVVGKIWIRQIVLDPSRVFACFTGKVLTLICAPQEVASIPTFCLDETRHPLKTIMEDY